MAELKHGFDKARMNKDKDERLVPTGEYRDANNIQVSTSEGSDAGVVQNIAGNKLQATIDHTSNAVYNIPATSICVGSIPAADRDKIYYFVCGSEFANAVGRPNICKDYIIEYDTITEKSKYVFVDIWRVKTKASGTTSDAGTFKVQDDVGSSPDDTTTQNRTGIRIGMAVTGGNLNYSLADNIFVTDISYDSGWKITTNINTSFDDDSEIVFYSPPASNTNNPGRVLNFRKNNIITGINVLDDFIYWTDNISEPKKINITRSIAGTGGTEYIVGGGVGGFAAATTTYSSNTFEGDTDYFHTRLVRANDYYESQLSTVTNADGNKVVYVEEQHVTVIRPAPTQPLDLDMNRGIDIDTQTTTINESTNPFWNTDANALYGTQQEIDLTFTSPVHYAVGSFVLITAITPEGPMQGLGNFVDYDIRVEIVSSPSTQASPSTGPFTVRIISIGSALAQTTARFNVRQETPESLFEYKFPRFSYRYKYTDGEYSPFAPFSEIAFLPDVYRYEPKEGYNFGMVNQLRELTLRYYHYDHGCIPDDISEIDILYKETNNPNVFVVKTLKRSDTDIQAGLWPGDLTSNNLDSQGNPVRGSFTVTTDMIHAAVPSNQILRPWDNVPRYALAQEVSANRLIYGNYVQNYTVEVDPIIELHLRQDDVNGFDTSYAKPSVKCLRTYQVGVVYSDRYGRETPILTGTTQFGNYNTITVFKPACETRNRLATKLSKFTTVPDWAEYMTYYVKETSVEYYNMASDRWYNAEDGNIWLSFNSADRNKLNEEDFIELKKAHGTNEAITAPARFKVLAIENEAPDEIRTTRRSLGRLTDNDTIGNNVGFGVPQEGYSFMYVDDNQFDATFGDEIGLTTGGSALVLHGNGGNSRSLEYRIVSVTPGGTGYLKISILEPFGPDVAFVSDPNLADLQLEIFELKKENLPEFDGRFFVKINSNVLLETYLGVGALNELEASDLVLYSEHNIGYLNNNGYTNSTAAGPADNPYHRVNDSYTDDEDYALHPTEYPGNYSESDMYQYMWGAATPGSITGYDNAHGCYTEDFIGNPVRMINDESGLAYNQAENFWESVQAECENSQAFFIDACTAFDLTSSSYAKPDSAWGGNYNWDAGGPGGSDATDVPQFHQNDMPGNMEAGEGQPSRGIWHGGYVMDLSWSGMGTGWNGGNDDSGPYDHTVQEVGSGPHAIAADFIADLVQPGTMFRFKRDPDPLVPSLYIVGSFAGLDGFGYGDSSIWKPDHVDDETGAYGIRNFKEGAGFATSQEKSRRQYRGSQMRQRWSILVNRPIGGTGYGYSPTRGTNPDLFNNLTSSDFAMPTSNSTDDFYVGGGSGKARRALQHDFGDVRKNGIPHLDAIQIYKRVDEVAGDRSHFAANPAVWETIPKEAVELDIYYQASGLIPLVTNDRTNEELIPIGSTIVYGDNEYIVDSWSDTTTIKLTTNLLAQIGANTVITVRKRNHYEFRAYVSATAAAGQQYISLHGGVNTVNNVYKNHTQLHTLDWNNCWAFGNGIESDRIRDDFNAPQVDNGVKASSGIGVQVREERRKHGLIWSGIYNSNAGINDTNQFIMAENITKDLNPIHGSIQTLLNRNTRLIMFCEDKILRAVTNRDLLFNADGNSQLVASNKVIGDVQAYQGKYGIATNPESMAENPYAVYFTDAMRGKVLRLTNEGIVPISSAGMNDYFADLFRDNTWRCLGTFDERKNEYNLTVSKKYTKTQTVAHENTTITYNDTSKGWSSFKSFIPQHGTTINNNYYTFSGGQLYKHHDETEITYYSTGASSADLTMVTVVGLETGMLVEGTGIVEGSTISSISSNVVTISNAVTSLFIPQDITFSTPHNTFYGRYYNSDVTPVFNDQKSSVKSFNTINYEGTQARIDEWDSVSSFRLTNTWTAETGGLVAANIDDEEYYNLDPKNGWFAESITTDLQTCGNLFFRDKEGKYFGYPTGESTTLSNLDEREFSVQGLGNALMSHDDSDYVGYVNIKVTNNTSSTYQGTDGSGGAWDDAATIADETAKWSATTASLNVEGGAVIGAANAQFILSPIINGVYSGTPLAAENLEWAGGADGDNDLVWVDDGSAGGDPDDTDTIEKVTFTNTTVAGDPSNEVHVTVTFKTTATWPTSDAVWYIDIDEKATHVDDTDPELRDVAFRVYWEYFNENNNAITPHNIGADAGEANVTETQITAGSAGGDFTNWKFVGNNIIESDTPTLVAEIPYSLQSGYHYSGPPAAIKENMGLYENNYTVEFPDDLKVYSTAGNLTGFTVRVYYTASSDPSVFPDPADNTMLDLGHAIKIIYDTKVTHSGMTDTISDVIYPESMPMIGGSANVIVRGNSGAKYTLSVEQKNTTTSDSTLAAGYYNYETHTFGTTKDTTEYTIPASGIYRHWIQIPNKSGARADARYDITLSAIGSSSLSSSVPTLAGEASIIQYGDRRLTIAATKFADNYTSVGTDVHFTMPARYEGDNYGLRVPKVPVKAIGGNGGSSGTVITLKKINRNIRPGMIVIFDGTYDISGADDHTPTVTHGTTVSSIDDRYVTISAAAAIPDNTLIQFVDPANVLPFEFTITPKANTLSLTNDVVLRTEMGRDTGVTILTNGSRSNSTSIVLDNIKGINIGDTARKADGTDIGKVESFTNATTIVLDTAVSLPDNESISFVNNNKYQILNASKVKISNDIVIRGHVLIRELRDNITIPILIDNIITAS